MRGVVGAALCAVVLAGCGQASAPSAPSSAAPSVSPKQVAACIPGIGQAFAFLPIAQDEGLFAQQGLEVSVQPMQGTSCAQSLVSGSIQFSGSPSTLDAIVRGAPYRVVFVSVDKLQHQFIVAKRIKSFADLKGGRVAISAPGGITDTAARQILKQNDLDPQQDVTFVNIGTPATRMAALLNGAADATAVAPDEAVALLAQGLSSLPFKPLPILGAVMTANQDLIKGDPDLVYRFVKACLMGNLMYGKKKDAVLSSVAKFVHSDDMQAVSRVYELGQVGWNERGSLDSAAERAVIDGTLEQLQVQQQFEPSAVFDFSFDERAYRELQSQNWQGFWGK